MRASRAYITSLGTTGVLIASSILLLAVMSTIVAFRGWPGDDIVNGLGSLKVGDDQPTFQITGPDQIAADAAPAAAAVAAAPAPGTPGAAAVAGTGASGPSGGGAPTPSPTGSGPVADPGSGATSNPGSPSTPRLPVSPSPTVSPVTKSIGDKAEGTTGKVGGTVGGVSPPVGNNVSDTGKAVGDIVRGLGGPTVTKLGVGH